MNLQLALYFLVILNPFSQILFLGDFDDINDLAA